MKKAIFLFTLIQSIFIMHGTSTAQNTIGLFDNHIDIGNPKNAGFAHYGPQQQQYTIGGAGANMWGERDEFQYLWTTIQGDFILRAEVNFLGSGVDPHRKAGWIVKNDLLENTAHVSAAIHGDGLTSLQYRKSTGGETDEIRSQNSAPDVIQLERKGSSFFLSTAKFGEEFTTVELEENFMDKEVYIGLFVCSHNPDRLETVTFRNVRISQPAEEDFQPYRDYIGSRLEIMDVVTGHRKVLFTTDHSIQAPNWSVDGENLIYNSKGLLYQYELATGAITPLNTGFATNNNNDHVLTFDGTMLGISHHNPENEGRSTLYYLPSEGSSKPKMVTKPGMGASYLHGWSPDNKKMVFTGERKGRFDIYSVNVKTGKEKQLTDQETLDDGPEYSPDGKFIFFNSVRTGKMKLWKMNANGKNQEQLTFDDYNDWFPHVSPDQKWIVFISFPKDIDPTDHPFYKHCLLRIMPYEGGPPKVIGYIYGGQGSINVPSWSPDSSKIAFVTNSR
ncbi:MAG: biopolymer transporter TolR [Bacteroidetes bacterium]|nr:MAG: biopolymer transporter TolR [Bacteroidota bacterium]